MMEKELLMAVSAYNLVRAVMCMAARRHGIEPRTLSFTHVLTVVETAWPNLIGATTQQDHDLVFLRVLDLAAQCTLPKRKKHRSFPRQQWRRGGPSKFRKVEN
jgi:putative transposase